MNRLDEDDTEPVGTADERTVSADDACRKKIEHLFRQGFRLFRVRHAKGEKVEALEINKRRGVVMVIGARGLRAVPLRDLISQRVKC